MTRQPELVVTLGDRTESQLGVGNEVSVDSDRGLTWRVIEDADTACCRHRAALGVEDIERPERLGSLRTATREQKRE